MRDNFFRISSICHFSKNPAKFWNGLICEIFFIFKILYLSNISKHIPLFTHKKSKYKNLCFINVSWQKLSVIFQFMKVNPVHFTSFGFSKVSQSNSTTFLVKWFKYKWTPNLSWYTSPTQSQYRIFQYEKLGNTIVRHLVDQIEITTMYREWCTTIYSGTKQKGWVCYNFQALKTWHRYCTMK